MKLFIRRIQIYFYKPQRLLVASIAAISTFFAISFAWIQVTKFAKKRITQEVASVSRKLNMPIDIGRIRVSPEGAVLENIVIGEGGTVAVSRMTASVGLTPFSATFGKLDNITVHSVRIKAPTNTAISAVSGMQPNKVAEDLDKDRANGLERLINRFFTSLPTNSLTLKSAGVTLVDEAGKPVLSGRGMKLHISKANRKVLFRADLVRGQHKIAERNLQGRFQFSQRQGEYQFFIKRKDKPAGKVDLWSVSGTARKDLAAIQIDAKLRSVPSFIIPYIERLTGTPRGVRIDATTSLQRTPNGKFNFKTTARSNSFIIKNPVISTDEIGPVRFSSQASGTIDPKSMTLDITSVDVRLPRRDDGKYANKPPRVNGQVNVRLASFEPLSIKANGRLELEPTSCQSAIDVSPRGLTPNLDEFKLAGDLSIGVNFRLDTQRPKDLYFDVFNTNWTCQVLRAPYSFTKEHLNGAFTLQRSVKGARDPIEISVNPFASDYTPIESIARTVNLALVTSEDNAFFSHKGIDLNALENAVHRNFAEKRIAVGGSTITMQTVKNLYLGHERTISRKIQEFFLAWHLEKILDKNRILEIYMNIVEFGPGIYGITNAAQHFFGKHPFDLNLVESAYLASVLPNPRNRYQNFCNGRLSPGFRDLVQGLLKRMMNLNRIPYERYASALGIQLKFNNQSRSSAWGCSTTEDDGL